MIHPSRILYIHGLESSSQSGKARLFSGLFPGMATPDFVGSYEERMAQLLPLLMTQSDWTLIGSSFGGLMAAVFTLEHPERVRRLTLLAPALHLPPFADRAAEARCGVPTILIHGTEDTVVPAGPVLALASQVFTRLDHRLVDDDHRLHKTFTALDWTAVLGAAEPD
jgi:pimeloyl-ACP methyl ester carboxylesterase